MKKEFSTASVLASFFNADDFHFYSPKEIHELTVFLGNDVYLAINEIKKQHPEIQDLVNKINQSPKNYWNLEKTIKELQFPEKLEFESLK